MFSNGDVTGAVASARAFRSSNPGLDADMLIARTLVRAKEFSEASAVLTQILKAKPDANILMQLAELAMLTGDKKRAESLLSDWLNKNPSDLKVRTQYATVLLQDGNNAKAVAQYEQILQKDPNNIVALNNLGWLLQKDDPHRALTVAALAAKLSPGSADSADTLGWIQLKLKDPKSAVETLKRAHNLQPKNGEITYHLVLALDASGNHNSAKGLLKALLDSGVKFDDIVDALKLADAWH
jgi:Tfp pilus assembly protein PilF